MTLRASSAVLRSISMTSSFAGSLDALSGWRNALVDRLDGLCQFLQAHELIDPPMASQLDTLRDRLGTFR